MAQYRMIQSGFASILPVANKRIAASLNISAAVSASGDVFPVPAGRDHFANKRYTNLATLLIARALFDYKRRMSKDNKLPLL